MSKFGKNVAARNDVSRNRPVKGKMSRLKSQGHKVNISCVHCTANALTLLKSQSAGKLLDMTRLLSVKACASIHVHRESKKRDTILLSIASPNIDRFSKLFHLETQ